MPFEGMVVKIGNYRDCGVAFGALKPEDPSKFHEFVPEAKPDLGLEAWVSFAADALVAACGQSVIVMVWGKNFVAAVVRGEYFEEADVKEEFLNYVNFLAKRG